MAYPFRIWIFQDTGFERDVGHVFIGGPWLGLGLGDWDTLFGSVVQKILSTSESFKEGWVSPWNNTGDIWLQSVEGQLESDLIVTLTSTTVGNSKTTFFFSNLDLGLGNDWSG
ncbi:hypothetical protein WICPIJ_009816 [Wickerhamomyces pijperi]|uniref:Uncharacterized protein n=1 Tax=Wickerhamomyces pijperi TaxID=599730 RepID=A0A9P8TBI5_WICPI|nr:hypothetical protein WICPIJ_009816 [Wickerhamomyces pijperi]